MQLKSLRSLVAERQTCNLKVLGSIPSEGFLEKETFCDAEPFRILLGKVCFTLHTDNFILFGLIILFWNSASNRFLDNSAALPMSIFVCDVVFSHPTQSRWRSLLLAQRFGTSGWGLCVVWRIPWPRHNDRKHSISTKIVTSFVFFFCASGRALNHHYFAPLTTHRWLQASGWPLVVFGFRKSNTPRGDAYWSAQDSNLESPAPEADALSIGPTDHFSPLSIHCQIHQHVNPKILSGNTSTPSIIIMRRVFIPISSKRARKALLIASSLW